MKTLPCPPEHWPEFSRLLDEAFERPAAERAAWLEQLATQHAHLKPWLVGVLKADAQVHTGEFLERPHFPTVGDGDFAFQAGRPIGPYRLQEPLGRGGMGEVWKAQRIDGALDRTVALKLPHFWIFASGMRQRLHRERDILASLVHPHIAQLHDAGVTGDGQPYLALELVDGAPIDEYCRTKGLTVEQRVVLFGQVLEAIRYAHSQLVVHRDLKPSNILVTTDGQVKLLDFGIAKLLDAGGDGSATELTRLAGRALTPEYAAPEQIAGDPVSVATDVYALGVILFQLVTGRRPFGRERPADVPIASTYIHPEHVEDVRCANVRELRRQIEGDLDAILARCLAPVPADRYASVEQLAEDLERHLRLEPIRARHVGRFERSLRFVRRNRLAVGMSAALVLVLAAGVTGVVLQTLRAQASAVQAREQARRADLTKNFMLDMLVANDTRIPADRPRAEVPAGELLEYGVDHIRSDFSNDADARIELLGLGATIYNFWGQRDRSQELLNERAKLAEATFGPLHPAVIQRLIRDANAATERRDAGACAEYLAQARRRLADARLEESALAAEWWEARFYSLPDEPSHYAERQAALENVVRLAAAHAPDEAIGIVARFNLAALDLNMGHPDEVPPLVTHAIEWLTSSRRIDRRSQFLGTAQRILALAEEQLGNAEAAERAWQQAGQVQPDELATRRDNSALNRALHALFLDQRGEYERSQALLDDLAKADAAKLDPDTQMWVGVVSGYCHVRQSRHEQAVPELERWQGAMRSGPETDHIEFLRYMAAAYEGVGRLDDARSTYEESYRLALASRAPVKTQALLARERRARFLLDRAQRDAARAEFEAIAGTTGEIDQSPIALARAGLARIAVESGAPVERALELSRSAVETLAASRPLHDVRVDAYVWKVRAAALEVGGDHAAAGQWARRADDALRLKVAPADSLPQSGRVSAGLLRFHPLHP